jgi:hypothetical protein
MTQLSKKPFQVAAAVCALLASVAIAAALLAYVGSGEAGPIRIESRKTGIRFESIEMHLFVLPGFMVLVLAAIAHPLFSWEHFSRKMKLESSYFWAHPEKFGRFDLPFLVRTVCVTTCFIQSIVLFISLYRSLTILNLL